jgi:hypothetical protein
MILSNNQFKRCTFLTDGKLIKHLYIAKSIADLYEDRLKKIESWPTSVPF